MPNSAASKARLAPGRLTVAALRPARRIARAGRLLLLALAVITSGVSPGSAFAATSPPGATHAAQHQHSCDPAAAGGRHGTPAKHHMPACMSDAGCLLVVAIPTMPTQIVKRLSWARVAYWEQSRIAQGIKSEPSLGPPIAVV